MGRVKRVFCSIAAAILTVGCDIVGGVVMMRCSSFKVRMRDGNLGGRCFFVWLVVASGEPNCQSEISSPAM